MKKSVYLPFLIISLIWYILIFLVPLSAYYSYTDFSIAGYKFFSVTCHQIESRSFFLLGYPLAVCSRCTSVYTGFTLAVILFPFIRKNNYLKSPPLWLLLAAVGILFFDASFDILDFIKNSFISRSVSGFIIGFLLPFYLLPGTLNFVNEINNKL